MNLLYKDKKDKDQIYESTNYIISYDYMSENEIKSSNTIKKIGYITSFLERLQNRGTPVNSR